jgi:hypothetical protein
MCHIDRSTPKSTIDHKCHNIPTVYQSTTANIQTHVSGPCQRHCTKVKDTRCFGVSHRLSHGTCVKYLEQVISHTRKYEQEASLLFRHKGLSPSHLQENLQNTRIQNAKLLEE